MEPFEVGRTPTTPTEDGGVCGSTDEGANEDASVGGGWVCCWYWGIKLWAQVIGDVRCTDDGDAEAGGESDSELR